jgi:cytochrome c-type biogenesis protein CcmH/NrfG
MDKHEQIAKFSILAKSAIDAGDAADANVYYNKMLELDPVRPDAWLGKARAMAISATLLDFKVEPV